MDGLYWKTQLKMNDSPDGKISTKKKQTPDGWLVVEPTHLKNTSQIGSLSPGRDEHQKIFELPPPSFQPFLSPGVIS